MKTTFIYDLNIQRRAANVAGFLFATALFLVPSSIALAGNGAGYGGPDLNPAAVPSQSERGVTEEDLSVYTRECMVLGHGQSEPLIAKVLKRIYGQPVPVQLEKTGESFEYLSGFEGWAVTYSCAVKVEADKPRASCVEVYGLPSHLILELAELRDVPKVRLATPLPNYMKRDPRPTSEVVLNKYGQRIVDRHLHFGVQAGPAPSHYEGVFYNWDSRDSQRLIADAELGDFGSKRAKYVPAVGNLATTSISFPYSSAITCLQQRLKGEGR